MDRNEETKAVSKRRRGDEHRTGKFGYFGCNPFFLQWMNCPWVMLILIILAMIANSELEHGFCYSDLVSKSHTVFHITSVLYIPLLVVSSTGFYPDITCLYISDFACKKVIKLLQGIVLELLVCQHTNIVSHCGPCQVKGVEASRVSQK